MCRNSLVKYAKFHIIPYLVTFILFLIVGTGKWTEFKQPMTLGWIAFFIIAIFVGYYSNYKCEFVEVEESKSWLKKHKEQSLNILSIIATVVTSINYAPSMGQIVVAITLILISTLFAQIAPKYNLNIPSTIFSIAIIGIILFNMQYHVSYSKYSEKLNDALENFQYDDNSVALEQLENILEDKYFKEHYSNSLLPVAVKVRNTISEDVGDSRFLSTSISTPIANRDGYEFTVRFSGAKNISFDERDVFINGFNAIIEIKSMNVDKNIFSVKLKDISGYSGNKRIRILGGMNGDAEDKISLMTPESTSFKYINSWEILVLTMLCLFLVVTTNIFFILSLLKKEVSKDD